VRSVRRSSVPASNSSTKTVVAQGSDCASARSPNRLDAGVIGPLRPLPRRGLPKWDRRSSSALKLLCATGTSRATAGFIDEIRVSLERAGTPIGPYDVLIAAQIHRRAALLVTANARTFIRTPGLEMADRAAD
jgi:hypothetical protein